MATPPDMTSSDKTLLLAVTDDTEGGSDTTGDTEGGSDKTGDTDTM